LRKLHLREYFGDNDNDNDEQPSQLLTQPAPLSAAVAVSSSLITDAARILRKMTRRCVLRSDWKPPEPPSFDLRAYGLITRNAIVRAVQALPVPLPHTRNIAGRAVGEVVRMRKAGNVVISAADKNAGVVAVSAAWYNAEAQRQLSVRSSYVPVSMAFAQATIRRNFLALQRAIKSLPRKEQAFILAAAGHDRLPVFYLLPKMHKSPITARPIVSWASFRLSNASAWLDAQLQPLLRLESSVLVSSNAFVRDLAKAPTHDRNCWFVTADIASLYTVMPLNDVKAALHWFLLKHTRLGNFERERISIALAVVELLMQSSFFTFDDKAFQQLLGVPMGTNCGPSVANTLLLHVLDRPLLTHFAQRVSFFRRFIDDLFGKCIDRATAFELRAWLLQLKPWLQFSVTVHDSQTEFMDLVVFKSPGFSSHGRLDTAIHFKPASRHLYLPWSSYHPRHTFSGIVVGELIRAAQLCSRPSDFVLFRLRLIAWLLLRGYPMEFLLKWAARVLWSKRLVYGTRTRNDNNENKRKAQQPLVLTLPFDPATSRLRWRDILSASWQILPPALKRLPWLVSWLIGRRLGAIFNLR
jgi:hypothetical protein